MLRYIKDNVREGKCKFGMVLLLGYQWKIKVMDPRIGVNWDGTGILSGRKNLHDPEKKPYS